MKAMTYLGMVDFTIPAAVGLLLATTGIISKRL
jgi:hypothetical protein